MKKLFITLTAIFIFVSTCAFADLHPTRRIVELSIDTDVGASNNFLNLKDFLVEKFVIDLQKFNSDMPKDGWDFKTRVNNEIKFSINTKLFKLAVFNQIDGAVNLNLDKDIFDYLVNGNFGKHNETFDMGIYGDVFDSVGVSVFTKIHGFGVRLAPAIYLPILYIPNDPAKINVKTSGDGIEGKIDLNLNIFSAFSLENLDDITSALNFSELMKSAGFHLSFALEKRIAESLEVGGYATIPITAGKLKYLRQQTYSREFKLANMISSFEGEPVKLDGDEASDAVYSEVDYSVFHPLKFGVEAAWQPFGSWFTLNGLLGAKIKDPYDKVYMTVFPEYDIGVKLSVWKIFAFNVNTSYINKIFMHQVGIMLNLRVLELDIKAFVESSDFVHSFKGSGAGAFVGIKIGF